MPYDVPTPPARTKNIELEPGTAESYNAISRNLS